MVSSKMQKIGELNHSFPLYENCWGDLNFEKQYFLNLLSTISLKTRFKDNILNGRIDIKKKSFTPHTLNAINI